MRHVQTLYLYCYAPLIWKNFPQARPDPLNCPHQRLILIVRELKKVFHLSLAYHQHHAGLDRMDIHKSNCMLVLIHFMAGDFAFDNPGKNTVFHVPMVGHTPSSVKRQSSPVGKVNQKRFFLYNMAMNILRKLALYFAGSILTFSLMLLVFAYGILQITTNPQKIKDILAESEIYRTIVPAIIEQNAKQEIQDGGQSAGVPLSDPAIKSAAEAAFSPEFIQKSSEAIIDSMYEWLEGETAAPEFSLDISNARSTFATLAAKNVRDRLESLPTCAGLVSIADMNIFNATCRPAHLNLDIEASQLESDILGSQGFLPDTEINAENFTAPNSSSETTIFEQAAALPRVYQRLKLTPIVLGIIAVISAAAIVLLSSSPRRGIRRIATTLIVSGLLLLGGILLVQFGLEQASSAVANTPSVGAFSEKLVWLVNRVGNELSSPYLLFSCIYLAMGSGLFIVLRLTRSGRHLQGKEIPLKPALQTGSTNDIASREGHTATPHPEQPTTAAQDTPQNQ